MPQKFTGIYAFPPYTFPPPGLSPQILTPPFLLSISVFVFSLFFLLFLVFWFCEVGEAGLRQIVWRTFIVSCRIV